MEILRVPAWLLAAALLLAAGGVAPAQEPPLQRSAFLLKAAIGGKDYALEAADIRPKGPGPFPLALILHGKPSGDAARKALSTASLTVQAAEFARRGYAALAVLRRGYGKSQEPYSESDGTCEATRYPEATGTGAEETLAILEAARDRPGVDASRVVVAGESVGGIVALAVAQQAPPGLLAAINFAGGRGGDPARRGLVCESPKLVAAVGALGKGSKTPTLWVYAENDTKFGPTLARAMLKAFTDAGGTAGLVVLPPVERDGHAVFQRGTQAWADPVDAFLKRLGLPAGVKIKPPGQDPPLAIGPNGRRAFALYQATAMPFKAFAVSGQGAYAWAGSAVSLAQAREEAVQLCRRSAPQCRVTTEASEIEDK
jgi:dienelactone hydrolase